MVCRFDPGHQFCSREGRILGWFLATKTAFLSPKPGVSAAMDAPALRFIYNEYQALQLYAPLIDIKV